MAFAEDLTQFFDTDDFAVAAVIKQPDGTVVRTANVILDTPTQEEILLGGGKVTAQTPKAVGRTTDLGDVQRNYTLTVVSTVYAVTGPSEDDGTGVSTLRLRKQ